jgi:hypothetical protein
MKDEGAVIGYWLLVFSVWVYEVKCYEDLKRDDNHQ